MQHVTSHPQVCVVILNWNGWRDTIACLESLLRSSGVGFCIALIDNASSDQSLAQIRNWAVSPGATSQGLTFVELPSSKVSEDCVEDLPEVGKPVLYLICSDVNLGFAAGCNLGSDLALYLGVNYIWFLNNDTLVEPNALANQVNFLESHPDIQATTGQIRYFDRPVIWNCGGWLTWSGSRKYLYHAVPVNEVPQAGSRIITFATGCALLIRSRVFEKLGRFTERFFFGEEDYEFSLRMKRNKLKIACCFDSVIYHKVSASVNQASDRAANRWYINYLNRFIDMRSYMPNLIWQIWRYASLAYILPMLKVRYRASLRSLLALARALLHDSARLDGVSKDHFEKTMQHGFEHQP